MNIAGMCHRKGVETRVKHIAELMAEAMALHLDAMRKSLTKLGADVEVVASVGDGNAQVFSIMSTILTEYEKGARAAGHAGGCADRSGDPRTGKEGALLHGEHFPLVALAAAYVGHAEIARMSASPAPSER